MLKVGITQNLLSPELRNRGWSRRRKGPRDQYILLNTRHYNSALAVDRHPQIRNLGKGLFEAWDPFKGQTNLYQGFDKAVKALEENFEEQI